MKTNPSKTKRRTCPDECPNADLPAGCGWLYAMSLDQTAKCCHPEWRHKQVYVEQEEVEK